MHWCRPELISPFAASGFPWRLDVYPAGYSEKTADQLGVCLELHTGTGHGVHARYEIALLDQSGRGEHLIACCSQDEPPLPVRRGCVSRTLQSLRDRV